MFKVGDRVVCINNSLLSGGSTLRNQPKLIKGREYIIYDIMPCDCGSLKLDVGLASNNEIFTCNSCGIDNIINGNEIHWCASERFRKVEEKKEYIAVTSNVEVEEPILN
jgi:hypothetical protein